MFGLHRMIIVSLSLCGFQKVSSSDNALLEAQTKGHNKMEKNHTVCVQYYPQFSEIASSLNSANSMTLIDLSKFTGCTAEDFKHGPSTFSGSAVAVSSGNCTFAEKADLVQSVNASTILIVDYSNSSSTPFLEGNVTSYREINITVTCIAWQDYQEVLALPSPVEVRIYKLESPKFDPNMIIIVLASTLIVLTGTLWSSVKERARLQGLRQQRGGRDSGVFMNSKNAEQSDKGVKITPFIVIGWVACLCGVLLLLYFFFDVMVYFFIGGFVIAGSHSMYSCILPLWTRLIPFEGGIPLNEVPCIRSKVQYRSLLLFLICITVAIFWAVERHASYAWILQDIIGTAFCIYMLQVLHIPSLNILTFLMVLLFCYDIFFVFITPLFTKDGQSIMIHVATGGNSHSGETIPMVFLIPILSDGLDTMCRDRAFSLLGFGDIILPGFLVVYNGIFGVHARSIMYMVSSTVAYAIGMSCCLVALIFMDQGQPALLYLVPATLFATYAVAFRRGEVRLMWDGRFPTFAADPHNVNNSVDDQTTLEEQDEDVSCTPEEEEQRNLID